VCVCVCGGGGLCLGIRRFPIQLSKPLLSAFRGLISETNVGFAADACLLSMGALRGRSTQTSGLAHTGIPQDKSIAYQDYP